MAAHSSIHARKIPQREEPGGLQSLRSQRVGDHRETEYEYEHCFSNDSTRRICKDLISK